MGVTRAEVAREAGVSPALVSYVLNGGPRPVSAEATERVRRAIERLGYRPNRIARALRENRTHSIAMIIPDHENPHFAELAQAVENEAYARDYILLIGTTDNERDREIGYLHAFVDRQVDGLVLISATSQPDLSVISDARIPAVLLDRAPKGSSLSTVTIDNEGAAREAVEHLLDHGRRPPACISGPKEIDAVHSRIAGWRAATRAAKSRPALVCTAFSREGGYEAMQELLSRRRAPDAVFLHSDAQAMGALKACSDNGLRAGIDIAIVSFDGTRAGAFTDPSLTSLDQGAERLARSGVEVLLDQINHPGNAPVHRVETAHLRIGQSCGCGQNPPD